MYCTQCNYNNPPLTQFCKNCERDMTPAPASAVRPKQTTAFIYAGFWFRLLAAFVDVLVLSAGVILLLTLIAVFIAITGRDSLLHNPLATSLFTWLIILMSMTYFVLMESGTQGNTLGKRWINIKVLDVEGNKLTPIRALARLIARLLSYLIFFIGFLIQPFTPRKQALHDLLASTIVIQTDESKKISIKATLLVLLFALMLPLLALFATAGMPYYRQHILDVQLERGIKTGKEATLAIAQFYRLNGRVPAEISDTGRTLSTSPHAYKININQQDGEITLTFSDTTRNAIRNKHLVFSPTLEADHAISWKCHSNDIEARLLPEACQ